MMGMKRMIGKGALVALILWFALAAGSVWASDHGDQAATGEGMPTADPHASAVMQGEENAGHAIVEGHAAEAEALPKVIFYMNHCGFCD